MLFESSSYGPEVAQILALDGNGTRSMPLAHGTCSSPEAAELLRRSSALQLFPVARAPQAAFQWPVALLLVFRRGALDCTGREQQ